MPLSRVPKSPDLERVVQVLGGRVVDEGPSGGGAGWVPAPPDAMEVVDLGPSSADLEDQLRRARRPSLVSVPASLRSGRVSVSSSAVVAVLALVVALGCAFMLRILWAERAAEGEALPAGGVAGQPATYARDGPATPQVLSRSAPSTTAGAAPQAAELVVHVVGQVARPGLVRLQTGARVADAITSAGGATRSADLAAMNLARALVDGEQVFVPRPGEQPPAAPAPHVPGGPASGDGSVNLNTADLGALDSLPGVGPVLAQRIIDWRTEHGRFTSVDELGEVSGIGDKLLSQLRPRVTV